VAVDPSTVVVTAGASGACVLAMSAAFDVGERVAVASPGYPCYRNMLTALGIEAVDIEVDDTTRFQLTPELLAVEVERGGPLAGVVVASPSNPTGTMLRRDELAALAAFCTRHGIQLISDEIYHGLTYAEAASTALEADPEAIVVGSFSKYFSMTGWRLGWMVVPPATVVPVERLAQNLTVAPPTLAQLAGVAAFDCVPELDGHVERYAANRRVLVDGLRAMGFTHQAPADGAFYLWVDVGHLTDDAEALCATWLHELGVAATPGIDFDPRRGNRWVRFSFCGTDHDVAEAVRRLSAWTERTT
jgi:aspartate/methionine/tyrosine aminotransferase